MMRNGSGPCGVNLKGFESTWYVYQTIENQRSNTSKFVNYGLCNSIFFQAISNNGPLVFRVVLCVATFFLVLLEERK